jgi:4-alpha-glucanotransferase
MTDRDGYEEPTEGADAGKPTEEASKRAELGSVA